MAKVSIIIPTYNVEQYLVECMDSVTRQTLTDIEIICINDGSTDGSLEILKRYAAQDDRIILVDKKNGGYGIGMNIGLDKATGEYIGIVEPDDFVPLNMYEDLYRVATENDLDFVKADFYRFTTNEKNGNMELVYNHLTKNKNEYNVVFDPSHSPLALKYIMNTWSGIYKREFIEKYHIRHNETPGASFQDNGFWFQTFIYAQRAMILDKPYYMNRRDNPNSSVNNPAKVYCMNVEYDHIRDILVKDPELWDRFHTMYWYKRYKNCDFTIRRIAYEFKREYVNRISSEFKRGFEKGEIEQNVFSIKEWERVLMIANDPSKFYHLYVLEGKALKELQKEVKQLKAENKKLKEEITGVKRSITFRVGKMITFIPRKIKKLFKR